MLLFYPFKSCWEKTREEIIETESIIGLYVMIYGDQNHLHLEF